MEEAKPKKVPNLQIKRKIDFVLEEKERDPQFNKYLRKWLSYPFLKQIRNDVNFWSILNKNSIKKEITESYAVYRQVKHILKRLSKEDSNLVIFGIHFTEEIVLEILLVHCSEPNCPGSIVISNTISQKIVDSIRCFCRLCFQEAKYVSFGSKVKADNELVMIDSDRKMNLSHIQSLPNVEFQYFDVTKPEFSNWLQSNVKENQIGSHLCGDLSRIFIRCYNALPNISGMVLVPCCLSKLDYKLKKDARGLSVDNYDYWTMYLYLMVQKSTKNICADEHMMSTKNKLICAVKEASLPIKT